MRYAVFDFGIKTELEQYGVIKAAQVYEDEKERVKGVFKTYKQAARLRDILNIKEAVR